MDTKSFGERIRVARERLGISQEVLAERLSKHQVMISQYESGKTKMFANDLPELAKALDVPINYFFYSEVEGDQYANELLAEFSQLTDLSDKVLIISLVRNLCRHLKQKMREK